MKFPTQTELAAQMGINSGAVAGRLHRGKELLRQLLNTKFSEAALALGLIQAKSIGWQRTHIWCSACGQQKLRGKFTDDGDGQLLLCCDCGANHGISGPAELLAGVRGFRPALTRAKQWQYTFLQRALRNQRVECPCCRHVVHLQLVSAIPQLTSGSPLDTEPTLRTGCTACNWQIQMDLASFAGNFPASIRFERQHSRVATLPVQKTEFQGASAFVIPIQCVTAEAKLDLIFHARTFALLDTVIQ